MTATETEGVPARDLEAILILRGAAGVIDRQGLHKHSYFKGYDLEGHDTYQVLDELMAGGEEPKCCTLGAMHWVAGRVIDSLNQPVVFNAIDEALGLSIEQIPEWNDKPSQRKDRVVAALRRAAIHLEEKYA